jgi:hypothetical protein
VSRYKKGIKMKTWFFSTFSLLMLLTNSPIIAQAQTLTSDKCTLIEDTFITKVDEKTGVCLNIRSNKLKAFYLVRSDNNYKFVSTVTIAQLNSGLIFVYILENNNSSTGLFLNGRRFHSWMEKPNAILVDRHKSDITLILNAIEEYNQRPSTLQF